MTGSEAKHSDIRYGTCGMAYIYGTFGASLLQQKTNRIPFNAGAVLMTPTSLNWFSVS